MAVVRLALQPAQQCLSAAQQGLLEQVSELQGEQLPAPQQWERAQELHASPQALLEREPEASPLQARDALPVEAEREPLSGAFSVPLWPPLPWLRDPLRRLPQRLRHLSNDDELSQQLRR